MNLDKWNSIPKNLQQLMVDIMAKEIEPEMSKAFAKSYADAIILCKNSGMTPIKFTQADEDRFLSLAKDSKWEDVQRVLPPETFSVFKAAATN
jgi:TRAP-type C4-dicarboxylate transport system substrate-binding protein